MIGEPLSRGQSINAVVQAARYAGHAAAMAVNLDIANMSDRAEMWRAEQAVWFNRKDSIIAAAGLKRQLEEVAGEALAASYYGTIYDPRRL